MGQVVDALATKRATTCNGYSALCSRQYSNVTFIGTHDSYAVGSTSSYGANQDLNVTQQLDSGVRALQIQGHDTSSSGSASGISLCHTSCSILNGGTLEKYLGAVTDWVKQNPNDVISIFIANNDNLPVTQWDKGFDSAGLKSYTYSIGSDSLAKKNWPTLQDMISKNQRVVVYMDYKSDISQVKYIHPEFKNVWENAYDQTELPFNCTADRINGTPDEMMYLNNHFLDKTQNVLGQSYSAPNVDQLDSTNSVNTILSNTNRCARKTGYYPSFLLVDFFNKGNGTVFQAAAKMNGVTYKATEIPSASANDSNQEMNSRALALDPLKSLALLCALVLTVFIQTM
ncbi:hypothetical protein MYAM1_000457 [Malassezia yamatoensis]|uniref:PLC-like phosphodiesterase n=1 Tax=Malassezia yamatoensis TaxID=253288 RepID=A0AAJ6CGJ1_9BASI|nr:hypothetical protein MYAM1_000457 [Malassezia yamatoensis]